MEKNKIKETFDGFLDETAMKQLESNDKQSGTSAKLAENMVFTVKGGTFVPNVREYESVDAAKAAKVNLSGRNISYKDVIDGDEVVGRKVIQDNSYYALVVDGDVQTISLRTLTSWAQMEDCPDGCLRIPAGKSSTVFERAKALQGKKIAVMEIEEWEEGDTHQGRKQDYAGRAVAFKEVKEG